MHLSDTEASAWETIEYIDKIEVIGWSRNGLLAYRFINEGGREGFNYHFQIVNTINDKIIEIDHFNTEDIIYHGKEIGTFREKWNILLEKHEILGRVVDPCAIIDGNSIMEFPLENYRCWFDYTINSNNNLSTVLRQGYNWKLIIGNNFVQKIVTQQNGRNNSPPQTRIKIIGYCRSPFENRIAVLVSFAENFSGIIFFTPKLYGCNMNIGFN
jgi:hypothetical protein